MRVDLGGFSPVASGIGGLMIGLAAVWLVLMCGRIAGISGIAGGVVRPRAGDVGWRAAFLGGLVVAPLVYQMVSVLPASRVETAWPVLIVAGLLVGIGTRYGAGCTSGHGVCGLSRLSERSAVAVAVFMGAGFFTVFVVRHVVGG